jgi:hypothetical protein
VTAGILKIRDNSVVTVQAPPPAEEAPAPSTASGSRPAAEPVAPSALARG